MTVFLVTSFQETFPEFYKYCCDIGKPDTSASLIFGGHEKLLYPFCFLANLDAQQKIVILRDFQRDFPK